MLIQGTDSWLTELHLLWTSDMLHNTITNCNIVDLTQCIENTILIKFFHVKYVRLSSQEADTTISENLLLHRENNTDNRQ